MTDTVQILETLNRTPGCPFSVGEGYMLKRGENVAAFYADVRGDAKRLQPICSSRFADLSDGSKNLPSVSLVQETDDKHLLTICFPEFEGWSVHSIRGGKTLAICLTKD